MACALDGPAYMECQDESQACQVEDQNLVDD